jgi:hypothetical protein
MGAVENVKEVADLIRKFNDIDLNRRILKLEEEVIDLTRDKRRAEERVEELTHALRFKTQLTFKDPYYWIDGDPNPYCPACWDTKRVAAHIVTIKEPMHYDKQQCPSCKHFYDHGVGA